MKKTAIIVFALLLFCAFKTKAQCVIDYSQTQPGIYPDVLPDGMVGSQYSESISFVLPLDTSGLSFTNFFIQSVSGLPFGLNWQCDSQSTNCNYNPQTSQYGCIEVYGSPLLAGVYPIDVSVIATLSLIGDVPTNYYTQLVVQPDTTSNVGFSTVGGYGCAPMTVSFINNNPGLQAYNWDFGNGTTSSQENPGPQIYTTPGEYIVNYEAYTTTASSYFLTNIEVSSADGWSGDLDDGFGSLNPDPYIKLLDQSGSVIYTSPVYVDQDFPVSWSISNIPLQNQTYTIEVWDEDGFWTGDDFCGSHSFQGFSSSNTMTGGGEIISYINSVVPPTPTTSSDTVKVFGNPPTPNIDSLGQVLWTDSLNLNLQWYQNGNPVSGATTDSLFATSSGEYFVVSTTPEGCFSSSDTLFIVVCDSLFVPQIFQSGNILYTDTTSYSIQWHQEGVVIPGATGQVLQNISEGDYFVQLTSYDGCVYISNTITVDFTSINLNQINPEFTVYPNPTKGELFLSFKAKKEFIVQVYDMMSRVVYQKNTKPNNKTDLYKLSLNALPGVYFITIFSDGKKSKQKLIIK